MFNLGTYKGGMIVEQRTVREHPLGELAARTVGYDRKDDQGYYSRVGLEGAFSPFLEGTDGHRLKQKSQRDSGNQSAIIMKWSQKTATTLFQL